MAGTGFLFLVCTLLDDPSPNQRAAQVSVAAIAWGALLAMHFRSAIQARRMVAVARVGALLAVVQVPIWILCVWVRLTGDWAWRLARTLAMLAAAGSHALYLTEPRLPLGHRWIVKATLGVTVALVGSLTFLIATGVRVDGLAGRMLMALLTLIIVGTMLVWVLRKLDPPAGTGVSSSRDRDRSNA